MEITRRLDAVEGVGRFYVLALILGLANAADAAEVLCVGFVVAAAKRDGEEALAGEGFRGALAAAVFFGMLLGGVANGFLSDWAGRKPALLFSLFLNGFAGLLFSIAAFRLNGSERLAPVLIVLRIFAGFGVGGSIPCLYTFVIELCPARLRGKCASTVAAFWMIGSLYTSAVAWFVLSPNSPFYLEGQRRWPIFAALVPVPAFSSAILVFFFVPESPIYLLKKGRVMEALTVVRRMEDSQLWFCCQNNRIRILVEEEIKNEGVVMEMSSSPTKNDWGLFPSKEVRRLFMLLAIIWFSLGFSSGVSIWISVLFDSFGFHDPYAPSLLYALGNFPGNIAAFFLMDILGRRSFLLISFALASAGAFFCASLAANLNASPEKSELVIIAMVAFLLSAFLCACWNVLDCVSAEVFDASQRARLFGLLACAGRLGSMSGNVLNSYLMRNSASNLVLGAAGLALFMGFGAGYFLRENIETITKDSDEETL